MDDDAVDDEDRLDELEAWHVFEMNDGFGDDEQDEEDE